MKVICNLFASSWCEICRQFTLILANLYNQWNSQNKEIEIIWINSGERSQKEWEDYYSEMPWLAIPYNDIRATNLNKKFRPIGVPSLFVVSKEEKILLSTARKDTYLKGVKAIDDWRKLYIL